MKWTFYVSTPLRDVFMAARLQGNMSTPTWYAHIVTKSVSALAHVHILRRILVLILRGYFCEQRLTHGATDKQTPTA